MGKLILRPETEEVLHRPDLTEEIEGYDGAIFLDVPADFTLKEKRADWGTMTIVDDLQAVRDRRWEDAKAAYDVACAGSFTLSPFGRIQLGAASDGAVKGIDAIKILFDEAKDRIDLGESDWQTGFKNEANDLVPVSAEDIIQIYREARRYLGDCFTVCQAKRIALDAAVAAGATAAEIEAIDVTSGYPAP